MNAADIAAALRGHRSGDGWLCRCPVPSHGQGRGDKNPSLFIRDGDRAPLFHCHGLCDRADVVNELQRRGLLEGKQAPARQRPVARGHPETKQEAGSASDRFTVARSIAARRRPAKGTIVETYLRDVRGYSGSIPATIGFLPATGRYAPAMIALFGVAEEPEPGVLELPVDRVAGIHLTRLQPDGSGKAGNPAKIMIGKGSTGSPIVLAPPNDLLGLAITEGIETGLSIHQATGLGVWAAGTAGRMPPLADVVPSYMDTVTIAAEDDASGRKGALELAARLKARGICTELRFLGGGEAEAT